MASLFKQDLFKDCTIIAEDGKEFKAHKGILACRSPVFRAMFEHGMVEAKEGIVRIKDIKSPILEQMLEFIYSGKAPKLGEMLMELLEAAVQYQIDTLKLLCEEELSNSIGDGNVCELLIFADRYSLEKLNLKSINFIKMHAKEVMKSVGWKMLVEGNYAELLDQIYKAIFEGLPNSMGNENVCELLILAQRHSADYLKTEAINYIQKNAKEVMETNGWKMLIEGNHGELFDQIVKAIVITPEYNYKAPPIILPESYIHNPFYTFKFSNKSDEAVETELAVEKAFGADMGNLFKQGLFTDFIIKAADGKEFKVHKAILICRSPVFRAIFEHEMIDTKEGIINIKNIKSSVLEQMIQFIYSGTAAEHGYDYEMTKELFEAAVNFQFSGLKMHCLNNLRSSISSENVCEILVLANRHSADYSAKYLKDKVINYIRDNANDVIETEGWKMLVEGSYGELFDQILKAIVGKMNERKNNFDERKNNFGERKKNFW